MAFRDDLEAAHARSDALEQRVAELEAENARLRGEPSAGSKPEREPPEAGRSIPWPLFALVVVLLGAAAVIARSDLTTGAVVAALAVFVGIAAALVASQVRIIGPNMVAVISGRPRRVADGRTVNYRLVRGGRTVVIPIIERLELLDLQTRLIDLEVSGAYSKGNVPLDITAVAAIKIAGTEPRVNDAVERFLGRPLSEVDRVAGETLAGHLRGVIARLDFIEIGKDREKFEMLIIEEAEPDLGRLGLELDGLKIRSVER